MNKKNKSIAVAVIMSFAAYMTQVQARESGFREAMDSCASELGITKPEPGQKPSDSERSKIDACLAEKGFSKPHGERKHGAFKACAEKLGIARPEKGQRPSDEDRAKIEACVNSTSET